LSLTQVEFLPNVRLQFAPHLQNPWIIFSNSRSLNPLVFESVLHSTPRQNGHQNEPLWVTRVSLTASGQPMMDGYPLLVRINERTGCVTILCALLLKAAASG